MVVTFESHADPKSSSPKVKIPDVGDYFDVKCIDLWELLRRLQVSLDLLDDSG